MRLKTINITPSNVDLTYFASDATGAVWTLTNNATPDGLAHQVSIRNDSATDHSAKTITLVGLDENGRAITETISAPGTSATVESTLYYSSLTSITPSATIGADTVDVGFVDEISTNFIPLDWRNQNHVVLSLDITGTISISAYICYQPILAGASPVWKLLTTVTADTNDIYIPLGATGLRLVVGSYTNGATVVVELAQPNNIIDEKVEQTTHVRNQNELAYALAANGEAYIPETADFLVENLTMPAGSKIYGSGTVRWDSDVTSTSAIIMSDGCSIDGISFRRLQTSAALSSAKTIVLVSASSNDVLLTSIKFYGELTSSVGYETWVLIDQHCNRTRLTDCRTTNGSIGCLSLAVEHGVFSSNHFTAPASGGLRFYGGKYNKIVNNVIQGSNIHGTQALPTVAGSTQTGINFLTFGFLGQTTGIVGNIIIGNEIYGVSEEGIGFDIHGQTFADTVENKVLPIATVHAIAQSDEWQVITLQESTTVNAVDAATGWADYCYMVVMTGGAAGYIAPIITGQSTASSSIETATIKIPNNNGVVDVYHDDKICITYGILDNIISDNIIRDTTTGISLWGGCWRNTISGNTVNAIDVGIQVAEVLGGPVTPNENTYTTSYSGLNVVTNNDIRLEFSGQGSTVARGWSPLIVGVWAYGAISNNIHHHIATEVTNNRIFSAKNAVIGGDLPGLNGVGYLSVYGGTLTNNRFMGGGGFAIRQTSNMLVGPNYLHIAQENFRASASASNTSLTEII